MWHLKTRDWAEARMHTFTIENGSSFEPDDWRFGAAAPASILRTIRRTVLISIPGFGRFRASPTSSLCHSRLVWNIAIEITQHLKPSVQTTASGALLCAVWVGAFSLPKGGGVSVTDSNTVARAYAELQEEGLVTSEGRRGTRVASGVRADDRQTRVRRLHETIAQFLQALAHRGYSDTEIAAALRRFTE